MKEKRLTIGNEKRFFLSFFFIRIKESFRNDCSSTVKKKNIKFLNEFVLNFLFFFLISIRDANPRM